MQTKISLFTTDISFQIVLSMARFCIIIEGFVDGPLYLYGSYNVEDENDLTDLCIPHRVYPLINLRTPINFRKQRFIPSCTANAM